MKQLAGSIALITGASSGIGEAAARSLARRKAHVILTARRADRLNALAAEIHSIGNGAEAFVIPGDLTAPGEPERIAREALAWKGRVDILVNNAGAGRMRFLESLDPRLDILPILNLDLAAPILLTRALLPGDAGPPVGLHHQRRLDFRADGDADLGHLLRGQVRPARVQRRAAARSARIGDRRLPRLPRTGPDRVRAAQRPDGGRHRAFLLADRASRLRGRRAHRRPCPPAEAAGDNPVVFCPGGLADRLVSRVSGLDDGAGVHPPPATGKARIIATKSTKNTKKSL